MNPIHLGILIYETRFKGRCLLKGIQAALREWPEATAMIIPFGRRSEYLERLDRFDGLLVDLNLSEEGEILSGLNLPVVSFTSRHGSNKIARSVPNEALVGQLAARHLLERGYERFMCMTNENIPAVMVRATAFRQHVEAAGRKCVFVQDPTGQVTMEAFLRELTVIRRPTGLFCWAYLPAYKALKAAMDLQLDIPEQLGIIGVNYDDVLDKITPVSLSRIDLKWEICGTQGLNMIRSWLNGRRPQDFTNGSMDVIVEASTKRYPIADAVLSKCLKFISENLASDLSRDALARHACASPRLVHDRFINLLGTSPARYILQERIKRARQLLSGTDLPVYLVAEASGFNDPNYFAAAFKRETGTTPKAYRRANPYSPTLDDI